MSPRGRLVIALTSTLLVGYIAVGSLLGRVFGDTTYGQLAVFNEVVRLVLDAYVEPVNIDRAMGGARMGLVDALDGDSAYLDDEEFKAYQQTGQGADATIGVDLTRRFSFLMVVSARPDGPAAKAGIRPGDIIKTIDGRHTRSVAAPVGQRLLRGEPGSLVKLTLLRAGSDPIDLSVARERLGHTPPQSRMLADGVAYLKVPEFIGRSAEEVKAELDTFRRNGAKALVLDLRGSGTGVPADGIKVAELLVKGVVGRLSGSKVPEQVFTAEASRNAWDRPVIALVDSGTAGPAEVVAAALSETGGASLVGEHTFGRAPLQRTVELPDGGLVLTVAKYMTPKGEPIHGKGLKPTVVVDVPEPEEGEPAPAGDPILDKALEVLRAPVRKAA